MKMAVLLLLSTSLFLCLSCKKEEIKKGTATFGANYGVINCVTNVTIYVDDEKIGKLESSTDDVTDCGQQGNLTKELSVGQHSYKVEIRPGFGSGCTKDITGTVLINENECTKVFIDYYKIDF
ncbi:MAG: hypothetical protein Q7T72_08260 [Bacteroidales bacterium]|nr:hypothetical protein [Bacteroidales bacterium]